MFLQFAILFLFIITTTGEADGRKLVGSAATNERHINFIGKITDKIMIFCVNKIDFRFFYTLFYLTELSMTSNVDHILAQSTEYRYLPIILNLEDFILY